MSRSALASVLVSICVLLSTRVARGQVEEPAPIEWEKRFSGLGGATALAVRETKEGGFALAGLTWAGERLSPPMEIPPTDGHVLRTDEDGAVLWEETMGGPGYDVFRRLEETRDGGFILTGWTEKDEGDLDLWLVRSRADGDAVWQRTFGSPQQEMGVSVVEMTNGDFVALGSTVSRDSPRGSALVIRVTPSGETVFEKFYDSSSCDRAFGMVEADDDGIVFGTIRNQSCGLLGDVRIIRADATGEVLSEETVAVLRESFGVAYDMTATADGGLAISGQRFSDEDFQFQAWVLRIGEPGWSVDFGGAGDPTKSALALSIHSTRDGGFITSGRPWLAKLDGKGSVLWQLGLPEADLHSARETRDGGLIVAGEMGERLDPQDGECLPFVGGGCIFGEAYLLKLAWPAQPASRFRRGDSNSDGKLDTADSIFTFDHLFLGGSAPACSDAADSDDSGVLDLTDGIHTLNHLFLSGPAPPAPGPDTCGADGTEDSLEECAYETAARC